MSGFWQESFPLRDEERKNTFFERASISWDEVFNSHASQSIEILNKHINTKLARNAHETYSDEDVSEVVELIMTDFENLVTNPDFLVELRFIQKSSQNAPSLFHLPP